MKGWRLLGIIALALCALACDDTWKGFKKDSQENMAAARRRADEAGVDEAAKKAADEASDAAARAKEELDKVAARLDETEGTVAADVKEALLRDDTLDASRIEVDVLDDEKAIVLRGSVPTLEQKANAARLASERSGGYEVRNELEVVAR
jgi:osmotically-inducible protein OsmY